MPQKKHKGGARKKMRAPPLCVSKVVGERRTDARRHRGYPSSFLAQSKALINKVVATKVIGSRRKFMTSWVRTAAGARNHWTVDGDEPADHPVIVRLIKTT